MAHPAGSLPAPSRPRMTFEEFLRSPYRRAEWVEGEVFELSPENLEHATLGGFLYRLLAEFAERHGLGRVLTGFLMKTGPHLAGRVPDVLVVSRENEHRIRRNYIEGPADIAVEIVSPDSATRDRETKLREYENGGVREYWLIDPLDRKASFYALEGERFVVLPIGADGEFRSRALPGLWLRPEWLLSEPRPKLAEVLQAWGLS
jgi:Uma2 family endonuclease